MTAHLLSAGIVNGCAAPSKGDGTSVAQNPVKRGELRKMDGLCEQHPFVHLSVYPFCATLVLSLSDRAVHPLPVS